MVMKKASEGNIVMKMTNGAKANIAVETEKMNKADKLLSPDLLLQTTLLPSLTIWIVRWCAGHSAKKGTLDGWMSGWTGGGMLIGTVIGVLVVVLLVVMIIKLTKK
jgi:hypothetical protein